ncbi:MAG: YggT family protein [Pseudomonadota bacterium]|nr:YggT family protein [Pseudomonadota bacterium]
MGSPLTDAGLLLVNALGSLALMVVVLRFLLQLVRADFYNPISQMIVKLTNPALIPLRRAIPGFGGIDVASLVLAMAVQYLVMTLILLLSGLSTLPWVAMIGWAALGIVNLTFEIYFWGMLIMVIASWVAPNSYNPALILINQLLEPVIRPIRRIMPDLGGLDLSPLVMILGIQLLEVLLLLPLKHALGLPSGLVMGL